MIAATTVSFSVFLALLLAASSYISFQPQHPHVGLNVEQLIEAYGYRSESHKIQTEDGYLLTAYRIPHGRNNSSRKNKIPVIMSHGILNSAAEYVCMGPGKSLALILADSDYDVWLLNTRGTTWSREHTRLDPDRDFAYWNFTMHEVGVYDTTAAIDYILNRTSLEKLHYIGYSQGTAAFFIAMSERPDYAKKIKLMSALAPIVYMDGLESPIINFLGYFRRLLQRLHPHVGILEFISSKSFIAWYINFTCKGHPFFIHFCLNTLYLLQGSTDGIDKELLPVITTNMPAGVATQQALHLLQFSETGVLQKYDWGTKTNLQVYNQESPEAYNLSRVTTPLALYQAKNDWVCGRNVQRIAAAFPNVVRNYVVQDEDFSHMEFVVGKRAAEVLYGSVVEEMKKY